MRIVFLAGYFAAWGTWYDSLASLRSHILTPYRLDLGGLAPQEIVIQFLLSDLAPEADLIVYGGINGGPCMPSMENLKKLRSVAPTVMICPEASDRHWWWKNCADYEKDETFDLIVNIDGSSDWPGADKGLTLLTPIDPAPWGDPIKWDYRYVECGFSGGNSNPYRAAMLSELSDCVAWRGPDPDVDANKTYNGYRDFMKQTKIAFNLSQHGTVTHYDPHARHVKGRVIEAALAGCPLVEGEGPIKDWFTHGEHYLTYESSHDARTVINILRGDQGYAREMGEKLRAKVLADYSPAKFWSQVFERVGMKNA